MSPVRSADENYEDYGDTPGKAFNGRLVVWSDMYQIISPMRFFEPEPCMPPDNRFCRGTKLALCGPNALDYKTLSSFEGMMGRVILVDVAAWKCELAKQRYHGHPNLKVYCGDVADIVRTRCRGGLDAAYLDVCNKISPQLIEAFRRVIIFGYHRPGAIAINFFKGREGRGTTMHALWKDMNAIALDAVNEQTTQAGIVAPQKTKERRRSREDPTAWSRFGMLEYLLTAAGARIRKISGIRVLVLGHFHAISLYSVNSYVSSPKPASVRPFCPLVFRVWACSPHLSTAVATRKRAEYFEDVALENSKLPAYAREPQSRRHTAKESERHIRNFVIATKSDLSATQLGQALNISPTQIGAFRAVAARQANRPGGNV